jgi:methionyl-tRNA formyltransferase
VVERDLADLGARLLVETVDRIEAGTATAEPQDEGASTYAPRLAREEGLIDWTLSAARIHNRVRGLHPWPHAYAYLDDARLILLKTHVVGDRTSAEPGKIVDVTRDAIHVATGHGGVIGIDELQAEGKRPMRTRDFLAGRPLQPGGRLT